eukprot:751915-Hanusia_phi.AAC.2
MEEVRRWSERPTPLPPPAQTVIRSTYPPPLQQGRRGSDGSESAVLPARPCYSCQGAASLRLLLSQRDKSKPSQHSSSPLLSSLLSILLQRSAVLNESYLKACQSLSK